MISFRKIRHSRLSAAAASNARGLVRAHCPTIQLHEANGDEQVKWHWKNLVAERAILPEQPQTLLFIRAIQHGEKRLEQRIGSTTVMTHRLLRVGGPSAGSGRTDGYVAHHGRMPSIARSIEYNLLVDDH